MSTARGSKKRDAGVAALVDAAREYSTAAVMLHGAVADRVGLSPTDLKALDLLQRMGPLSAGEIANLTGLATASVTALIDRLERRRFVRRTRDRSDRRRVVITLTGKLQETIAPLFDSFGRRMLALCRRYDGAELARLRDFLSACAIEMRAATAKVTGGDVQN